MFILRRTGGISAKELAGICGAKCGKKVGKNNLKDFIINYGEQYNQANLNKNVNFNKVDVHLFLEKNGIKVPKLYRKNEKIDDKSFPLLARKNYHSKGRDIIYIKDKNALKELNNSGKNYDYLIQYIEKVAEYRVHILEGYTKIVNIKVNNEEKRDEIVRNRGRGWIQIEYNGEFYDKLVEIGEEVTDLLEYDFAVIDIIRDKKNNLYVLEINSAPGLEKRKLKIYADFFKKKEKEWLKKVQSSKQKIIKEKNNICVEVNNQGIWAYSG